MDSLEEVEAKLARMVEIAGDTMTDIGEARPSTCGAGEQGELAEQAREYLELLKETREALALHIKTDFSPNIRQYHQSVYQSRNELVICTERAVLLRDLIAQAQGEE